MSYRFNDEDFDGVCLMIDSGFIATNPEIKKDLDTLYKALKNCKFSTMMPSYTRNLTELSEYSQKKEFLNIKKEENQRYLEREKEILNKKLNHEVLPITTDFTTSAVDRDIIYIMGLEYEYLTPKGNIKSSVIQAFNEFLEIADREKFKDFCNENRFYVDSCFITPLVSLKECKLYIDSYFNIVLKIPTNRVQVYGKGKRDKSKLYCREVLLQYDYESNKYFISYEINGAEFILSTIGGSTCGRTFLDGYTIKNNNFIKL